MNTFLPYNEKKQQVCAGIAKNIEERCGWGKIGDHYKRLPDAKTQDKCVE